MRIKIKVTNDDRLNLNKRWIRNIFLIVGITFITTALSRIFLITVKPKGYENILAVLGNEYLFQLILGILFWLHII